MDICQARWRPITACQTKIHIHQQMPVLVCTYLVNKVQADSRVRAVQRWWGSSKLFRTLGGCRRHAVPKNVPQLSTGSTPLSARKQGPVWRSSTQTHTAVCEMVQEETRREEAPRGTNTCAAAGAKRWRQMAHFAPSLQKVNFSSLFCLKTFMYFCFCGLQNDPELSLGNDCERCCASTCCRASAGAASLTALETSALSMIDREQNHPIRENGSLIERCHRCYSLLWISTFKLKR